MCIPGLFYLEVKAPDLTPHASLYQVPCRLKSTRPEIKVMCLPLALNIQQWAAVEMYQSNPLQFEKGPETFPSFFPTQSLKFRYLSLGPVD